MSRYNLLHESWIEVVDENNHQVKVSMLDIFKNAHNYKRLSGETAPQDFAILRLLLAVLYTTFSRYNVDGTKLGDDKNDMQEIWKQLWKIGKFPKIVSEYLISQENKFYLYDDKYPFMQITKDEWDKCKLSQLGHINTKTINRLISESEHKMYLFSPTSGHFKDVLHDDELARWLISFQGYTGIVDKGSFTKMKESRKWKGSKGWLLSIGGIFLQGENIFQTLLLNLVPERNKKQHPIWEKTFKEMSNFEKVSHPKDLADLYTNCSRLICINPNSNFLGKNDRLGAIKLPPISDEAQHAEPMTLWKLTKSGKNVPKVHQANHALWRSFNSLSIVSKDIEEDKSEDKPKIINWYNSDAVNQVANINMIKVCAVGMPFDDSNPAKLPIGEYYDEININPLILFNNLQKGWHERIANEVYLTKLTIYYAKVLSIFLASIRNKNAKNISDLFEQELYFAIDEPFKRWISGIDKSKDKNDYIVQWHEKLFDVLQNKSKDLIMPITARDLHGKINKKTQKQENSIIVYQRIMRNIKNKLGID